MKCLNRNCLLNEKGKCLSKQVKEGALCVSKDVVSKESAAKKEDIRMFRNDHLKK